MAKFRYVDKEESNRDPFDVENETDNEFAKMLSNEAEIPTARRYRMGETVEGVVISTNAEFIFVDLGGKSSGSLSTEEFTNSSLSIPKAGDTIQAFVRSDNGSEIILTKTLRKNETDDTMLRNAHSSKIPVEAKVAKVIKGGFEALIGSKRCFVPLGQMDVVSFDNPEVYVGNTFTFMITEMKGRNVVLSRKIILREEMESKMCEVLQTLEVGQNHRATVTRLTDFGAFVSINGVEGLLPLSEMAWKRIKKADEIVHINEEINVKIIKLERSPKLRLVLSLKEAGEDPWIANATRLNPGEVLQGTVARFIDTGAFVTVADGVDGLVPIGQITWEKRIKHPKDILQIGQAVKVHVMACDLNNHRLSLSIKGPMPDELLLKMKGKKRDDNSMSSEDKELMQQWEEYKSKSAQIFSSSTKEDANIFAAAFQKARSKK